MAYFSCQFEKSKEPNVEFIVCLHINLKCVKPVLVSGKYQEVKYTIEENNELYIRFFRFLKLTAEVCHSCTTDSWCQMWDSSIAWP
jgi:hypothetical protein